VHLDEVAHDGQPQPEAAVPTRRGVVGLAEGVEDVRQEVRINPLPGVAHLDLEMGVDAAEADRDAPA
jgi:hypothetical protein